MSEESAALSLLLSLRQVRCVCQISPPEHMADTPPLFFLCLTKRNKNEKEFTYGYLAVAAEDLVCAIIPSGTSGVIQTRNLRRGRAIAYFTTEPNGTDERSRTSKIQLLRLPSMPIRVHRYILSII